HPLGPRFYAGLAGLAAVTMGGYLVVWRWPAAIQSVPYLYLWVDVLLLAVPLAWFWASNARHRRDLLRFAAYLLPVSLANEVVALSLNQWSFPAAAEFVARLPFVGQPLPLEELFFLVFAPPAIMAYYVFLMRDRVQ
ncbi:MAG TPA: hypothetical protein VLF67_02650, partial [Candidatus Saccharimonas sp.]|nr:hypothetical protein [Candidatus Saccharimonas sp.]